jgi:peptidoglycan-associated lipoprotein
MMPKQRIAVLTMAMLSVTTGACRRKAPEAPAPVTTTTTSTRGPDADSARRAADEAARRAAADEAARRAAADEAARRAAGDAASTAASLRATLVTAVHFEYDQSDLRSEDRAILDAKVPILQANSGVTIQIAGHTDERGSDEYNLALGQRRAAAVKAYLVQRGIGDGRITTVTFGEERPAAQGSDESAFALNRRAEFEITAGGQSLRRP